MLPIIYKWYTTATKVRGDKIYASTLKAERMTLISPQKLNTEAFNKKVKNVEVANRKKWKKKCYYVTVTFLCGS